MTASQRRTGRTAIEAITAIAVGDDHFAGTTQNVGVGGVFVATSRFRRVGERIAIAFTLPGRKEPISVAAEVRWIRDRSFPEPDRRVAGMGLRFVDLPIGARFEIQSFLNEREQPDASE
jgi:uncharacterized protein (TIGR02266 family)